MGLLTIATALALSAFTWGVYNTMQKGGDVAPTNSVACTSSANTFVWSGDSKWVTIKHSSKFVIKQTLSDTATLRPGGEVQFANGVIIRAPAGFPINPVVVTSKNIDPNTPIAPIPDGIEPIVIFNIATAIPAISKDSYFSIGLPIPSGYENKRLYVLAISPGEFNMDSDLIGDQWDSVDEQDNPDQTRKYLLSSGIFENDIYGIFAEVSAYSSKFVVQGNSSISGVLQPGGSWTSKDEVRIVAPVVSTLGPVHH